jgi:hypothetical protein
VCKPSGRHLPSVGERVENPTKLMKGELIEGNYAFRCSFYHSLCGRWCLCNVSRAPLRMSRDTGGNCGRFHCNSWRNWPPDLVDNVIRQLKSFGP